MQVLYKHTQMAWAIIIPVDIIALVCLYLALAKGFIPAVILFFFLVLLTYLFYSLTVIGTEQTLELRFAREDLSQDELDRSQEIFRDRFASSTWTHRI